MITRAARCRKILVVDDEELIRKVCSDVLCSAGYDVTLATDGVEALDRLRKEDYDLVVTDVRMPVMDGVALYEKALRECEYLKGRFLFMTGEITEELLLLFTQKNLRYLWKPFKMIDLVNCVDAMTSRPAHMHEDEVSYVRREPRVALQKACDVTICTDHKTNKARTVDMSGSGMRVRYKGAPLVRDAAVNISFSFGGVRLERRGSVVWSRPVSAWDAVTGMRLFEGLPIEKLVGARSNEIALALD